MSKKRGRKHRRHKHGPPKRRQQRNNRAAEQPTVIQAMARNTQRMQEAMQARASEGDRFAELLAKTVKVTEDETYLMQQSGLTKVEAEELHGLAPEYADRYERALKDEVVAFQNAINCVNPLPVIAVFMMENVFGIEGLYFEPLETGRESKVEFVVGSFVASNFANCREVIDPTRDLMFKLLEHVEKVFELAHLANLAREMANDPHSAETDVRFRSRAHRLSVRGSSYAEHGRDLAKAVFGPLSDQVTKRVGFGAHDVIDLDIAVTDLVETRVNEFLRRTLFRVAEIADEAGPTPTKEQIEEASGLLQEWPTEALTITTDDLTGLPREAELKAALEALSLPLGEEIEPYSSPWDTSPLSTRPFVRYGDRYMLPVPGILSREMSAVMEPHVKPHLSKFEDWRAKQLDEEAVSHLVRMLPGAQAWTSLYYWVEEDGQRKRVELDGLVLYEGIGFILEGKANPLAPPSLRGDVKRLRNEIKKTVERAFQQAIRAKNYVSSGKVTFENERGDIVVEIDGSALDRIYTINPTLHELGDQAVQLGRFHELGLFQDESLPFSVFINDLRVISEIVQVPMEFIHYLEWRARLPLGTRVAVGDELDLFGSFLLRQQLDRMIASFGYVHVGNTSTDFDAFFMSRNPRAKDRPKMLMLGRELRDFADRLARERPDGWMDAVGTCLELSLSEVAIVSAALRRLPEISPGEMGLNVITEHPEQDPNGGGVSIAVIALGEGRDRSEVDSSSPELSQVQRVVVLRRSSRKKPMIDWAWTNPGVEVKLPLKDDGAESADT